MNNFKQIVIANWKMNLSWSESLDLAQELKAKFQSFSHPEVVICPDFLALERVKTELTDTHLKLGAQDMFWQDYGSYTGEIAPSNLKEVGCHYVILGHSERRQYLQEDYAMINSKVKMALQLGLTPIMCIGETKPEKEQGRRDQVLEEQIRQGLLGVELGKEQKFILAYEPIWAIGSGQAIETADITQSYQVINKVLETTSLKRENILTIYGGSVDQDNISDLANAPEIEGLLIGGASLEADKFFQITKTMIR